MLINLRNGLMAGGKHLPYDAEVEYLESTGTQWIDTGINPNMTTIASIDVQATSLPPSKNMAIFGRYGANNDRFQFFIKDSSRPSFGIGSAIDGNSNFPTSRTTVTMSILQLRASYGDVAITGFSATSIVQQSMLLGSRGVDTDLLFSGKYFGCKIYSSGILVRDYQPVRFTNENGVSEGAMFDRANPTVGMNLDGSARDDGLYRNQGTGVFGYGNDI